MKQRDNEIQVIRNDGDPHRYFHQMLNMAEDDLDPFQYRLLGHYLRWAGHGGSESEGIRETAKKTKMSIGKVRIARAELLALGYLEVKEPTPDELKEGKPTVVTVIDRWQENIKRYTPVSKTTQGVSETAHPPVSDSAHPPVSFLTHYEEHSTEDKDSAPDGAGVVELEKPKRVIKRSPIFITLARESFGIFNVDELDKAGVIRINILERWLKNNSAGATDQTLMAFYKWYDKTKKIARPKGESTFAENFTEFKQQALAEVAKRNTPEAQVLNAREDRNRAKAEELRRAMEGVA